MVPHLTKENPLPQTTKVHRVPTTMVPLPLPHQLAPTALSTAVPHPTNIPLVLAFPSAAVAADHTIMTVAEAGADVVAVDAAVAVNAASEASPWAEVTSI